MSDPYIIDDRRRALEERAKELAKQRLQLEVDALQLRIDCDHEARMKVSGGCANCVLEGVEL